MILPDREIKKSLAGKLLVIDPPPALDAYASTSVDLTLDPRLRIFRDTGAGIIIDPGMPGYRVRALLDGVTDTFQPRETRFPVFKARDLGVKVKLVHSIAQS